LWLEFYKSKSNQGFKEEFMDVDKLNEDFAKIAELVTKLDSMDYSDEQYDDVEEELHDLEDQLMEDFGDELEDAIAEAYDNLCPDNDVLLPTAYIAKHYVRKQKDNQGRPGYDIEYREGIPIESDKFPDQEVYIALVPGPTRLVVTVGDAAKQTIWMAK
tara:strand:+ start:446 stop:922 length:477 start_codon:yes stop_codon:yes gene_type:complete